MITIIDYGMGNLRSVQKALEHIGASATIVSDPAKLPGGSIKNVNKLLLPGVGAFGDCIANVRQRGWVEPIKQFIASGKPFLGICLGMQMLFDGSEEDAPSKENLIPGLGILPGKVVRFPSKQSDGSVLKVPHMGWNTLRLSRVNDPLLRDLPKPAAPENGAAVQNGSSQPAVYFVHGYYVKPDETSGRPIASGISDYAGDFTATIWRDNIWATQFHPEKSQQVGLKILRNFAGL